MRVLSFPAFELEYSARLSPNIRNRLANKSTSAAVRLLRSSHVLALRLVPMSMYTLQTKLNRVRVQQAYLACKDVSHELVELHEIGSNATARVQMRRI